MDFKLFIYIMIKINFKLKWKTIRNYWLVKIVEINIILSVDLTIFASNFCIFNKFNLTNKILWWVLRITNLLIILNIFKNIVYYYSLSFKIFPTGSSFLSKLENKNNSKTVGIFLYIKHVSPPCSSTYWNRWRTSFDL